MRKLELTDEERQILLIQIGARIDHLTNLQREEGKNENIKRVLELEELMKPLRSGYDKIFKS